ncbi:MAG: ABC transporter permease subunit [Streptococcaceae bacterium]|jgi:ABC-type transport system involved in multi-copper enzyme maturation permease subunit|nr:ABC transporter permease subunit [Streptococcaceae bacterium]
MLRLIRFELDKMLKNKFFLGIVISSLLVMAGMFFLSFRLDAQSDSRFSAPTYKRYEGDLTDDKVKEIVAGYIDDEEKRVESHSFLVNPFYYPIVDNFVNTAEFYQQQSDSIEQKKKLPIDQVKLRTLKDVGFAEFERPLKIGNYVNWTYFMELLGLFSILGCIVVILVVSTVFVGDRAKNIDSLLLTTKFGRTKLIHSKIAASLIFGLGTFLSLQAVAWLGFLIFNKGFSGWDTSIQTNFNLGLFSFSHELNQLQAVLLNLLFELCCLLVVVGVTLLISSVMKTPIIALSASLGLLVLPLGLIKIFKTGFLYKLLALFPINTSNTGTMLNVFGSKQLSLFGSFYQNLFIVTPLLILISVAIFVLIYQKMKHVRFA